MKKRSFFIVFIIMFILGIKEINALTFGDCDALVSYKASSGSDENKYICKNQTYGNTNDSIYYSGEGETIVLNNFNAYYFSLWDQNVSLEINGNNIISLLHTGNSNITVKGTGNLKFKESSYAKEFLDGEAIYQFIYNDKTIIDANNEIFEGTINDFKKSYNDLKVKNNLPEEYVESNFNFVQVIDYLTMTSVGITDSWFKKYITTELDTAVVDGYGVIKYVKKEEKADEKPKESQKKSNETTLKSDDVILVTKKKISSKYKLNVDNLNDEKAEYNKKLDNYNVLSLYDVSVYNGKKEVKMKNDSFIIKIKLDTTQKKFKNYKIIYVDDKGEIAEYINGKIEDGYIVFETSHLSKYGVIAEEIEEKLDEPLLVKKEKINIGNIMKISILVLFALASLSLILFVILKSKKLTKKKIKKRA